MGSQQTTERYIRALRPPGSLSRGWERCELSSRLGRCAPGVCKNGGSCVNLLVGGFKCECPPGGYEKPYCQMSTRNFPPQSFLTFRGLRQRFHFTLSLSFATREPNGLLLYNGRFNEKHDFIAMEIINEQIQLTFSAGETKTTVSPYVLGGVSDGQWHSVQVHYYNKRHAQDVTFYPIDEVTLHHKDVAGQLPPGVDILFRVDDNAAMSDSSQQKPVPRRAHSDPEPSSALQEGHYSDVNHSDRRPRVSMILDHLC
ncbi:unnamed protein product [Arctogadus glacialis]